MPLPGMRLIHQRFQQHHQATVQGQMGATCRITRPESVGTPAFDEATATSHHPAPLTVYEDVCRARGPIGATSTTVANSTTVGDRQVSLADYVVTIPADAQPVQAGDLVEVLTCPDDPALVGLPLQVTSAQRGSIVWQRDVACQLSVPTTR